MWSLELNGNDIGIVLGKLFDLWEKKVVEVICSYTYVVICSHKYFLPDIYEKLLKAKTNECYAKIKLKT